jgi:chromosome segregation ATPase
MTGVLITYKTKKPTDSSDEQQKILVELPKIKSVIEGLQEKVSWLQILPFNKKQLSSSEVKEIEKSLENVRKQFNGLYEKIIISQSILVESDNDKQEEDTKAVYFQNWLEKLLQSIKKEIITDVKSTSLDETTQNTLKDLSNKFSNIQEIVGSLSIGKEGGSISQHKEKVDQLDIKIKEYEDQKERHLTRIRELTDERNRLSQNLAEQRQQIEQFSSGEVEQLRKENQRLSSSSQNLETRLCNVKIEKAQLEQQATTLNSQVNQLQQDKKALELKVQTNVQDIEALKKEIERLRKLLNKEAIETGDIPRQWQNIINSYNQSPDAILNIHGVHKQGEVVEDEDKGAERRNNSSKPVVLTSNVSPDGFYIVLVGNDYLLFPKQHAIAASQKFTVSALFDGYRSGNTSKFTLISPAQVTPVGSSGMWQLKHKGKLEYN